PPPRALRGCIPPRRKSRRRSCRQPGLEARRSLHRGERERGATRESCAEPPFLEPEPGDVLHVFRDSLLSEEQLRVPDLEGLADAEKEREVLHLAFAAHHRRKEDSA